MASHLIYHPRRSTGTFSGTRVYYDRPSGNQDPYLWNDPFLHTYCHMTELVSPEKGDIQFWVAGDTFPTFSALYCDLVFTVRSRCIWTNANEIAASDPIVDSPAAYHDHYRWHKQHFYKKRQRFTLKADSEQSFQPQTTEGDLIDILPWFNSTGCSTSSLRKKLKKGVASRPLVLPTDIAHALRSHLRTVAAVALTGAQLQQLRSTIQKLPR
jgi:hypothetical protein